MSDTSTCARALQTGDGTAQIQSIRENAYVEADRHIGLAMEWIREARHAGAPVALKTCLLLLDLLTGVRAPLSCLGGVGQPKDRSHQAAAGSPPTTPEFAVESSEVAP